VNVLITGGAGYIGSHTARRLTRRGHRVRIYDNLSTGHRSLAEGFELVVGDVGDPVALALALRGIDAVLHFAGHAYVGESVEHPRKYFENNLRSGMSLLNSVLDSGIRNFVFSSTCAVYGIPKQIPICEDDPREPVNPYGASKYALEMVLEAYSKAYGLSSVSLRYFNAAGADEGGEIGEMHEPETHLIPCALEAAAGLRDELTVFGDDYATPDGTCVRDYVHVNDLAEAHVLALEYLVNGGASTAVNLGTGEGKSIKELVTLIEAVTGKKLPTRVAPRRAGDPPVLVADASRAREVLKWRPSLTMTDILSSALKWSQRENGPVAEAGSFSRVHSV
jgi:UDP-glucose-4-epimerase GalE